MSDPTAPTDLHAPSTNGSGRPAAFPPGLADLPPVEAPSAGFIVQLFVIPAVVVLVVILVWLLFGKLAGGERDAMEYVRLMRASDSNSRAADRAAFELASLIQNDSKLAADPKLLGELTELLNHDLDKVENPGMTQYLALALGKFQTLDGVNASGKKMDPLATLARASGPKSPEPVRLAAVASLAKHAARVDGTIDDPKAVAALADAGATGDVSLRQLAAYALGFFAGDAATAALRDRLNDEDRFARYNAAVALARRDDQAALGYLREMLRPDDLAKVVTLEAPSEKASKIEAIELEALNALQTASKRGRLGLANAVKPELERLAKSELAGVRAGALDVLKSLQDSH